MATAKKELTETGNGASASAEARVQRLQTNPRRELVREQLIDIAARMFDSKGYMQTGMADIAREIGLGRSAVYHYFSNKEEILAALVEAEAWAPSLQLQEIIDDSSLSPTEKLRRGLAHGIVRRLSAGSRFLLFSRLETQIPDQLGSLYNRSRRHIFDFYVRCIRDGIAAGEFREVDSKVAAFAVIGMANWTSRWYSPNGQRSPEEIAEIISDIAIQGLKAPTGDLATARTTIQSLRGQIDDLENMLF